MNAVPLKHSYTIPCSSAFRDAVEALAARRRVNVGDIARSVLLLAPSEVVSNWPDPGEPPAGDRETVELKSGPSAGRPWRRKPRLQVRMPPGHEIPFIRKALGVAIALDRGDLAIDLSDPSKPVEPTPKPKPEPIPAPEPPPESTALAETREEIQRLRAIISVLAFEPLADGVRTRSEALHVLGFPPDADPDSRTIRAKFRMLATIHHPDSALGSHQRMSQLNQAISLLRHR